MRAGRVILVTLLLLSGGCKRKPQEPAVSLREAIGRMSVTQMRSLIARGADVNEKDGYGWTPLHVAARIGHPGMAQLLIAHGADVDANDGHFGTPLHYAAYEGHAAVLRRLIGAGANVNLRGLWYRSTPLQLAFARHHIEVARLLLAGGADPNVCDEWGRAVLHDAALHGSAGFAKLLFVYGAQVNAKDTEGLTPLHEAVWENQREMVQLLLAHGGDVNAKDIRGETPLHVAARNGYKELYDLLITAGAQVSAEDEQGHTPIDYAQVSPALQTVTLFADGKDPYSVIIVNPSTVREFLRGESILYDRVWIPGRQDIEGLDLKAAIERSPHIDTKTWFDLDYILNHLSEYNREYAGFIRRGKRYVLCNMDCSQFHRVPGGGFSCRADGGCSMARVVIDLTDGTVVRIDCNGN